MSPEALLAEKLPAYRRRYEQACRELFVGGEDAAANDGAAEIKSSLLEALRDVADDFAREFNAKLTAAANSDASVALVADNYEMTPAHVDELADVLAAAVKPLVTALDAGDLVRARRAAVDGWPQLERRVRSKWQAYFVFTFQDVSVERKAARDRRKLQKRFNGEGDTSVPIDLAEAKLRAMPDLAPPLDAPGARTRSPWLAVLALLLLAAAGGWLLVRHAHVAAASAASGR